jgi:hypothetical protein
MERIGYRGIRPLAGALYPRGHGGVFGQLVPILDEGKGSRFR